MLIAAGKKEVRCRRVAEVDPLVMENKGNFVCDHWRAVRAVFLSQFSTMYTTGQDEVLLLRVARPPVVISYLRHPTTPWNTTSER